MADRRTVAAAAALMTLAAVGLDQTVAAAKSQPTTPHRVSYAAGRSIGYGAPTYEAGVDAIVTADLDHDGRPDLIVAGEGVGAVLFGRGHGEFTKPVIVHNGTSNAVAVGDFNRDGHLDLAFDDDADGAIVVVPGGPGRTFGAPTTYQVGGAPIGLAAADVNGDGHLDLVFTDAAAGMVSVLVGGNHGFTPGGTFPAGAGSSHLAVGDFNGDHHPDLAVTNDAGITILLGAANATYSTGPTIPDSNSPVGILARDVNGDGKSDLIITNARGTDVSVRFGRGNGGFGPPHNYGTADAEGGGPAGLALADLNRDGHLDLVVANLNGDVSILLGRAHGRFVPNNVVVADQSGYFLSTVAIGDFDGDGRPDLIAGTAFGDRLTEYRGEGDGQFVQRDALVAGTQVLGEPDSVTFGDVNGDGVPDLLSTNYIDNAVSVRRGLGAGRFAAPSYIRVGLNSTSVATGDLNRDQNADAAVVSYNDTVTTMLGGRRHLLRPIQSLALPDGSQPLSVIIADLNGDGRGDVVTADSGTNQISVAYGRGDGTLHHPHQYPTGSGTAPYDAVVADVNGDHRPDIVTANDGSATVSVLLAKPGGGFAAPLQFPAGESPVSVVATDLNGDGHVDVAVCDEPVDGYGFPTSTNALTVLIGDGHGGFTSHSMTGSTEGSWITASDINGDGIPDLAIPDFAHNTIDVFTGNGDGSFRRTNSFQTGAEPYTLAEADINGDDRPDFATSDYGADTISVVESSVGRRLPTTAGSDNPPPPPTAYGGGDNGPTGNQSPPRNLPAYPRPHPAAPPPSDSSQSR